MGQASSAQSSMMGQPSTVDLGLGFGWRNDCVITLAQNVTAVHGRWKLDNMGRKRVVYSWINDAGLTCHQSVGFRVFENGAFLHFQVDLLYEETGARNRLMLKLTCGDDVDPDSDCKSKGRYFQASMFDVKMICESIYEQFGDYNLITNNCQHYSRKVIEAIPTNLQGPSQRPQGCNNEPSLLCMFVAPRLARLVKRLNLANPDQWEDRIAKAYRNLPDFGDMLFVLDDLLDDLRHTMQSPHEVKALERFLNELAPPMFCESNRGDSQDRLSSWVESKRDRSQKRSSMKLADVLTQIDALMYGHDYKAIENRLSHASEACSLRSIAGVALRSDSEKDLHTITFQPGRIGWTKDSKTGLVKEVKTNENGQAEHAGVKVGWHVVQINGKPFTDELLSQKIAGNAEYAITFTTQVTQQKAAAAKGSAAQDFGWPFGDCGAPREASQEDEQQVQWKYEWIPGNVDPVPATLQDMQAAGHAVWHLGWSSKMSLQDAVQQLEIAAQLNSRPVELWFVDQNEHKHFETPQAAKKRIQERLHGENKFSAAISPKLKCLQNAQETDLATVMELSRWLTEYMHRARANGADAEITALQQLVYAYTLSLSI